MNKLPPRKIILISAIIVLFVVFILRFWNYIFYPHPIIPSQWEVNSIDNHTWIEKISSEKDRFRVASYTPVTQETAPFQGKLFSNGCMLETYYAIYDSKTNKYITTKEQLVEAIGKINTPEQAMAYIFTLNEYNRGYSINNSIVTPNYVKKTNEGFLVGFTMSMFCGCSHPSYTIQVSVKQNGDYKEESRKLLNKDTEPGLCVD